MRSNCLRLALLGGLLALGTGASPEGVRQADRWQKEADLARAGGQWDIAYDRYFKLAETSPECRTAGSRSAWPATCRTGP